MSPSHGFCEGPFYWSFLFLLSLSVTRVVLYIYYSNDTISKTFSFILCVFSQLERALILSLPIHACPNLLHYQLPFDLLYQGPQPHNLCPVLCSMCTTSVSTSLLPALLLKYRSGHAAELLRAYRIISNLLGLVPKSLLSEPIFLVNYLNGRFCSRVIVFGEWPG